MNLPDLLRTVTIRPLSELEPWFYAPGILRVTSVCDMIDIPYAMKQWKNGPTEEGKLTPTQIVDNAKLRGTYIHAAADCFNTGTDMSALDDNALHRMAEFITNSDYVPLPDEKVKHYLRGWDTFLATYGTHIKTPFIDSELQMISKGMGIGGRMDACVDWDGLPTIVDWKTSSQARIAPEFLFKYKLQLSAYVKLYNQRNLGRFSVDNAKIVPFTLGRKMGLGDVISMDMVEIEDYFTCFTYLHHILMEYVISNNLQRLEK